MSNIAELFVRVRADVGDVNRRFKDIERGLGGVDRVAKQTQLSTGRLGNQFASLAGQIAGVHPIVGNLAQVMGNFAIGGAVTVAVLGGLALIATAYDKLTDSSRKAMEQSDKLIESLLRSARIRALGVGGEQTAAIEDIGKGTAEHGKRAGFFTGMAALTAGTGLDAIFGSLASRHAEAITKGGGATAEAVTQYWAAVAAANDQAITDWHAANDFLEAKRKEALAAARKDAAEEAELQKQISDLKLKIVLDELQKIAALHAEILGHTKFTGMPDIAMPFEGLDEKQKKQLQQLGILTAHVDKSAEVIRTSIGQSANIIANAVLNASPNIGGGGKGAQLGGQIGFLVGGAAGSLLGPPGAVITSALGGAVGSVIGGLAGSLFGGLFDSNKKEVNANTQALRANTQALLLYAPAGFKSEPYRYNASDPRPLDNLGRNVRWNASRGGANPLLGT